MTPFRFRFNALLRPRNGDLNGIASFLGLPVNALEDLRDGRAEPSLDTIFKLATYFGVPADYLAGYSNNDGKIVRKIVLAILLVELINALGFVVFLIVSNM